jgi:hypothetical protein
VCPSQALFFGTHAEIQALRPRSRPVNTFQFGRQTIHTKVQMMVPREDPTTQIDVAAAWHDPEGESEQDDAMLSAALFELPVLPNEERSRWK